jgi:multidrug transporter EmrE-like cation transporter
MDTKMRAAFLLFAVLALTVYGQLIIKARALAHGGGGTAAADKFVYLRAMLSDPGVFSGLAAAALAAIAWMFAIERLEVGFAYPFMALSFVFVPLGAKFLFAEPLPPFQILGMVLIVVGITMSALAR